MTWPAVALGDQWTALSGVTVDESGMYSRIDAQINTYAAWLNQWGSGVSGSKAFTRFMLVFANGAIAGTGVNLGGTVIDDTATGWNATNKNYTVPTGGGLYVVGFNFRHSVTIVSSATVIGIPGVRPMKSGNSGGRANTGCRAGPFPVRFSGGEVLSVQYQGGVATLDSGTVSPWRCWFHVDQVGY